MSYYFFDFYITVVFLDQCCGAGLVTLLPGGRKFCKITQKGPLKIFLGRGKLGAVSVWPQILTKSGRKGPENIF